MDNKHYLVPTQKDGIEKDIYHTVMAQTIEDAEEWFVDAKNRLLDVNHWDRYSKLFSADFQLTDAHGNEVNRRAHRGDHLRIDAPGPGSAAGDAYDWVVVEAIEYDDYPDEDRETMAMRVRPSSAPDHKANHDTAFCSSGATSTFVIERSGNQITAHYHGRNEKTNTNADGFDVIRTTGVAVGPWLGLSDVQWTGLIKGLLE